jgi:hypothetical protein
VRNRFFQSAFKAREALEMEQGRPSFTAMVSAMLRAAHLLWDDPPKIFEEAFAFPLSEWTGEVAFRDRFDALLAVIAAKAGAI